MKRNILLAFLLVGLVVMEWGCGKCDMDTSDYNVTLYDIWARNVLLSANNRYENLAEKDSVSYKSLSLAFSLVTKIVAMDSDNSSTAVYGQTYDVNIRENSSLRGKSNFATSKREAEKVIESFNLGSKLILRLPLVLGPNPPGNLGRLLKSISSGSHIYLQGNHAQKSVVFASDVANFISHWLLQPTRDSGTVNLCNQTAPAFNWIENAIAETVSHSFRFRVPIKFLWATLNWIKAKLNISFPLVGKLFYPLTFSDQLAREKYGYTSKPLNQTSFTNELNSNS